MKVGAYQAPLAACESIDTSLGLIREQIDRCESEGIEMLCCPEGVLGGLADYASQPASIAIDAENGELQRVLAPLASDTVTTILGFTENDRLGRLYNSAAIFHQGLVLGVYRKARRTLSRTDLQASWIPQERYSRLRARSRVHWWLRTYRSGATLGTVVVLARHK
jgi:predicted amidohydrolase